MAAPTRWNKGTVLLSPAVDCSGPKPSREETDIVSEWNDGAGDRNFIVELGVEYLLETCGEGEQGFTGTGTTDEGDELNVGIEQKIECHFLFFVARKDVPNAFGVV